MKRKLTKYIVVVISILTAELLHEYIHELLHKWLKTSGLGMYVTVLISMAVAVAVFYPAFHLIEKYVAWAAKKYVDGAKRISGGPFKGLLIGFVVAIILLFIGFCQVWYHVNVLHDLF